MREPGRGYTFVAARAAKPTVRQRGSEASRRSGSQADSADSEDRRLLATRALQRHETHLAGCRTFGLLAALKGIGKEEEPGRG
ncbi:hypothetical protein THAOC_31070 [Thalassiosira oceanica]|uniref:Uncharacterized protein n=1 Tax=Thalassiosira oceanica TaxID=159749 RepID=K0RTI6_THAOC|nr:hypothetical protein THAOC_31070 [Thalassiosira oceanica]|eukprot:EJK50002.1 hypothetical protein THAOC_31070 [Thalassiosira oceanica]